MAEKMSRSLNEGSQKCLQHPGQELKFYCETHDTACCVACTVLLHNKQSQCNVKYIPEAENKTKTLAAKNLE